MTYDELMENVTDSGPDDWLFHEQHDKTVWVYRYDLDIRLEYQGSREPFGEKWATKHSDPNATCADLNIYFRSSLVKPMRFVTVDGGRAVLPLPKHGTNTIARGLYRLAQIIDRLGKLDEYIERSGLEVGE